MKKVTAFILMILITISICSCNKDSDKNIDNNKDNNKETISFDKKSTQIIAHRGLSGLEIENTEEAFIAAGERSYYGIEADVRRTADNKFVICHDKTLKRIANVNMIVEESTFEELINTNLTPKNNDDQVGHICGLETYISICKNYSKHAFLELKSAFTETEIFQIIEIINSYDYLESVTFISFNYSNLEYVKKLLPNHSVQYLFSKIDEAVIKKLIDNKIDVGISYKIFTEEYLMMFHNAGLKVNCWTIDDKELAEHLASLGVDYITTGILE